MIFSDNIFQLVLVVFTCFIRIILKNNYINIKIIKNKIPHIKIISKNI